MGSLTTMSSDPPSRSGKKGQRWGSVARRGARDVVEDADGAARSAAAAKDAVRRPSRPDPWAREIWVEREQGETGARKPSLLPAEVRSGSKRRRRAPAEVAEEIGRVVGTRSAGKVEARLMAAASAFDAERWQDAVSILRPLVRSHPAVHAVRELMGLSLYRQGRWEQAIVHLEALFQLTGAVDQHPVMADCHRALGNHKRVDALWRELRESSPAPEVLDEGRIVVAGARADRGDLAGAIRLLERGPSGPRRGGAREHQLRVWYALGDLYERSGDTVQARTVFARLAATAPGFADVSERVRALA